MNGKILAVFMALVMVGAAVAVCVPATSDATETGTESNPYYLKGNATQPAILQKGNKTLEASIDFNEAAYDLAEAKGISFALSFNDKTKTVKNVELGTEYENKVYGITITKDASHVGIYKVTFALNDTVNSSYIGKAVETKIKIDLTTAFNGVELTLNYYYAANIISYDSGESGGGGGGGDDPTDLTYRINLTSDNTDITTKEVSGKNVPDIVKVLKGVIPEVNVDLLYNEKALSKDTYTVYASGLPGGLSVKVSPVNGVPSWVITGKVDSSIEIDSKTGYFEKLVTIHAVDNSGNITTLKDVKFRVYSSGAEFDYKIINEDPDNPDPPISTTTVSGKDYTQVIMAGTSVKIQPMSPDNGDAKKVAKVYSDKGEIPLVDGYYVYESEETDNGVVEIIMENSDGTYTVQHKVTVLVVGEIVHAGLNPVVTSS